MAREYTPEELGLAPAQKEYTPQELGLDAGKPKPDALGRYIAGKQEYTPAELGLAPSGEKEATVASQFVGGVKQAGQDYSQALQSIFSQEEANKKALEGVRRQQEIEREVGKRRGLKEVGQAYEKSGIPGAALEVAGQVPGAIAGSGAQMITAMGGNVAGGAAGTAVMPGLGTALGAYAGGFAALFPQFYAENLTEQAQEAIRKGEPVDVSRGKAALAGAGQAALEEAGMVYAYGKNFLKGLFGKIPTTVAEKELAQKSLIASAESTLKSVAAGAGKTALEESFVNPAQDILERAQAGEDLFSKEAIEGYGESIYGSLLQSPLGAAAGFHQNRSARAELRAQEEQKEQAKQDDVAAKSRFDELNRITSGVPAQTTTDENGNTVTIPEQLPRFFTPEEIKEYQKLKERFEPNHVSNEEKPVEVVTPENTSPENLPTDVKEVGSQNRDAMLAEVRDNQDIVSPKTTEVAPKATEVAPKTTAAFDPEELIKKAREDSVGIITHTNAQTAESIRQNLGPEAADIYMGELQRLAEIEIDKRLSERKVAKPTAVETEKPVETEQLELQSDIPNEDWLKEKQEASAKYGNKPSGAPKFYGTVTGTFNKNVLVPVDELAKIAGENQEQQNVRQDDLAAIKKIMSETGRLPKMKNGKDYVPFITVAQDGTPYISEGNHRIMAAKELGFKYLPVEIKYFNGAERQTGALNPEMVQKSDAAARAEGLHEENYKSTAKEVAPTVEEKPVVEEKTEPKEFDIDKSNFEINKEIKNLDAIGLTKWLIANANNKLAKDIAEKLNKQITRFKKAGVQVNIIMLNGKDRHKKGVQGTSGVKKDANGKVYFNVKINGLNSKGQADESSIGYQIIMHELLHSVSQLQLWLIENNRTQDYQNIQKDLASILRAVKKQNKLEKQKDILDSHTAAYQGRFYKNTRELFAYGLSNAQLQDYLSTIKVGEKTLFSNLVDIARRLIGLDAKYDTALDKLMRVGDRIFQMPTDEISLMAKSIGWTFGEGSIAESKGTATEEIPSSKGIPDIIKRIVTKSTEKEAKENKADAEAATPLVEKVYKNYKGQPFDMQNQAFKSPEESRLDNWLYKIQDKQIDLKRVQELIGQLDDDINVYDKEQVYHGTLANRIRQFLLGEVMPLVKSLFSAKVSAKELITYLHNRHALRYNEIMNDRNKNDPRTGKPRTEPWDLQDRASGIATKDAQAYFSGLDPKQKTKLEDLAKLVDSMIKETQKVLVESGAETQETVDKWNDTFEFYVPLFRKMNEIHGGMTGTGKGLGTRGPFGKRAMGSEREVEDILAGIIKQREKALIRAEKIKVGRALYTLAIMNPNPSFWLAVNPDAIKNKEALIEELRSLNLDNPEQLADNLMAEPQQRYLKKTVEVDPNTGLPVNREDVALRNNILDRWAKNVFPVRINGKDRYIFFNKTDPRAVRMVESLMNFDAASLGDMTAMVGKLTRWFASVNTQYNPIFGAVNLIRDVGGAMFNLTSTVINGYQKQVSAGIIPAMRGIFNVLRDERKGITTTTGKWAKLFKEFREEGGQTGYRDSLIRRSEEHQLIQKELTKLENKNSRQAFSKIMGALSDFNDMMENAVRVSAYAVAKQKILADRLKSAKIKPLSVAEVEKLTAESKAAKNRISELHQEVVRINREETENIAEKVDQAKLQMEKEQSIIDKNKAHVRAFENAKQAAAILSKNLTVNFDKKGQQSAQINAFYAFFNASVQGSARLAQTLKGPMGKKIIAGGIALGTLQAVLLAMAGFRDDEPPEFVKERNFIIPTGGGKYITIPYPLGLHILPNIGRVTTEFVLHGGTHGAKRVTDLSSTILDAFNPMGGGNFVQTVSPTILDPYIAVKSNQDAFGRPIYREDKATNPTPGYMRSRETATEVSKQLAYFLNLATGGSKYTKGIYSPTADELDYYAGQATGGVGREIMKTTALAKSVATGEEVPAYRIPLAGRFYGDVQSNAAESQRFYTNITRMAEFENEVKGRQKNRESIAPLFRDHPEARYWQQANNIENEINALNKQKRDAIERGLPKERIKQIEDLKIRKMKMFNDQLKKYE
jgi:hypothetical protein